jgi:ABC-type uncharacterized transport system substrate-binding protein
MRMLSQGWLCLSRYGVEPIQLPRVSFFTKSGRNGRDHVRSRRKKHSLRIALIAAPVHNDTEIEAAIAELGREPGSGLLGMPDNFIEIHRALIISLAARNNIPAVYQTPVIARDGGLLSYGADFQDIFHRAARYVDQILRGAKPAELPVQLPTKYLMVIGFLLRGHAVAGD